MYIVHSYDKQSYQHNSFMDALNKNLKQVEYSNN